MKLTPSFKRRVERAAKKAGWVGSTPIRDDHDTYHGKCYWWSVRNDGWLHSMTRNDIYLLAARLLGIRPSGAKGAK